MSLTPRFVNSVIFKFLDMRIYRCGLDFGFFSHINFKNIVAELILESIGFDFNFKLNFDVKIWGFRCIKIKGFVICCLLEP